MTADALHAYDHRLRYVDVVSASGSTYCLESTIGDRSAFKNGPDAQVFLGTCAQPDQRTPVAVHTPEDSQMRVRAAVPAMEAYAADHHGYAGMTLGALHTYDASISDVTIVSATRDTYCVESGSGSEQYFKNGPGAPIAPGSCPAS
jgi:hypothetical protein